jgi:hypothetical protein
MSRLAPYLIVAAALAATATAGAQPADDAAEPEPSAPSTPPEKSSPAATTDEGSADSEPAAPAESPEVVAPREPKKTAAPEPPPKAHTRRNRPAPRGQPVYEPPPPGAYVHPVVYEPPPPPPPAHVAPKTAFWLGGRIGWFVPFGNLWANCTLRDAYGCIAARGVPFSDYASSGPMFEVDVGVRLGRRYNLLLLWERAELGEGKNNPEALPSTPPEETRASGADSDYYALGFRFSSDPDEVGFLTEFALGYRRARVQWDDGTELQLTDAPFEFRLGLGADIRFSSLFALSPLVTVGFGGFGEAEWVYPDGSSENARTGDDLSDTHGWFTLQVGGHFDLAGSG